MKTQCIFVLILLASGGAQAQFAAKVSSAPVADGIYMLTGMGGNIGVSVGDDGVFIIDDQLPPATPQIQAVVADITPQPIRVVFNTHWHNDHTGGNKALATAGAMIFAHENVRRRMNSEQFSAFFNQTTPASAPAALPVVTFSDAVTLHLNGQTIEAFHVPPAHTDGDTVLLFREANVVHTGDTFFNGMYPFIDLDSGGSVAGMIVAIDLILLRIDANTRIIPGHGPLSDIEGLKAFRTMLVTVSDRVRKLQRAGKTATEVAATHPSAEYDEKLAWEFIPADQWVALVYASVAKETAAGR